MKAEFEDNNPIINDLIELLEEPQEPETAEVTAQPKKYVVMPTFTRQETRGPRRQLSADDKDDISEKLQ